MSTFTVARYLNGCYEAFSFSELNWKGFYSWVHFIENKEFISFQGVYDPEINTKLAPCWLDKNYDYIKNTDKWFDVKQVITTNKGKFNVYNGDKAFKNVFYKIGDGWCCAGNLLQHQDYSHFFNDDLMQLTSNELLTKIKQLPVKLDKRTDGLESKGNYYEYTLYNVEYDIILKRETYYQNSIDIIKNLK